MHLTLSSVALFLLFGGQFCYGQEGDLKNVFNFWRRDRINIIKVMNDIRRKFAKGEERNNPKAKFMRELAWNNDLALTAQAEVNRCIDTTSHFNYFPDEETKAYFVRVRKAPNPLRYFRVRGMQPRQIIAYIQDQARDYASPQLHQIIYDGTKYVGCASALCPDRDPPAADAAAKKAKEPLTIITMCAFDPGFADEGDELPYVIGEPDCQAVGLKEKDGLCV